MRLYIEREIHIYIYTHMSIFSSYSSFFLCLMYSSKKKRKKTKMSSFFLLLYIEQGRVLLEDLAWRCYCCRRHHHHRRYDDVHVYIFSFQLLLLPLPWLWWCVQVCYSLALSFSFFFSSFFFRFDWRSRWWMLYAVSFSLPCSVTIHFTRVLLCLSYSAPLCSVSMHAICIFLPSHTRVSRHVILHTGKINSLFFFVTLTEHYRD